MMRGEKKRRILLFLTKNTILTPQNNPAFKFMSPNRYFLASGTCCDVPYFSDGKHTSHSLVVQTLLIRALTQLDVADFSE